MGKKTATLLVYPLETIDREIEDRQRKQNEAARAQETVENELSDKRNRLEIVTVGLELEDTKSTKEEKTALERSIAQLDQTFQAIKDARSVNARLLSLLSGYRAAIQCLERDLPKGIFASKEKTPAQS